MIKPCILSVLVFIALAVPATFSFASPLAAQDRTPAVGTDHSAISQNTVLTGDQDPLRQTGENSPLSSEQHAALEPLTKYAERQPRLSNRRDSRSESRIDNRVNNRINNRIDNRNYRPSTAIPRPLE